ncbi:Protein of unknown function DUF760 [Dillenia turbinata]|uniref:UV-B-induced protein At3g17800, chloroplastic-like n=1 Tax=Dillenia turbinata TaxID=194707 RepID=A0AAN8Z1R8_9MAGN
MEAASFVRSSMGVCRPPMFVGKSGTLASCGLDFVRFGSKFRFCSGFTENLSHSKIGHRRLVSGSRRCPMIRASISSESEGSASQIAPLQLKSPIGQLLSQILVSHPHLVPAAVDQQLEQLQTDRDAERQKEEPSVSGTELILYRRIAEVKSNERRKALEEILYALIVQKFKDANVSMVPTFAPSDSLGQVDSWPGQEQKLEQLHSPEAYEMIQNHLSLILGNRMGDSSGAAQISKLRVGQVYAASVMYGYFLKQVDQRFQLEKVMKILPQGDDEGDGVEHAMSDTRAGASQDSVQNAHSHPEVSSWAGGISPGGFGNGIKSSRLRTYVMSFDADTLQRYATIRSIEAVSIIEKHTEALVGRPEILIMPQGTMNSSKDEHIEISFGGLRRLVLEAVTFGSFLWDVESYVDSRYHFELN